LPHPKSPASKFFSKEKIPWNGFNGYFSGAKF